MNRLEFKEIQTIPRIYLGIIFGASGAFFIYECVIKFEFQNILPLIIIIGLGAFFYSLQQYTVLNPEGISTYLKPFQSKPTMFEWSALEHFEIVNYEPLKDYGGWGLRNCNQGEAITLYGSTAIKLVFKIKRTVLIGTNDPKGVERFLNELRLHSNIPYSSLGIRE